MGSVGTVAASSAQARSQGQGGPASLPPPALGSAQPGWPGCLTSGFCRAVSAFIMPTPLLKGCGCWQGRDEIPSSEGRIQPRPPEPQGKPELRPTLDPAVHSGLVSVPVCPLAGHPSPLARTLCSPGPFGSSSPVLHREAFGDLSTSFLPRLPFLICKVEVTSHRPGCRGNTSRQLRGDEC